MSDTGDGRCVDCGDYFHLDDCGGYNPSCPCCGLCRLCCKFVKMVSEGNEFDDSWVSGEPGEKERGT